MSINVAETSDKSFTNRLLTLVAVLVAVANIAIYAVVYQASWNEFGTASPVVLDDIDTGVYRLAVKSVPDVPWNSTEPHVEASDYDGELTEDQVTAHRDGWDASCISTLR